MWMAGVLGRGEYLKPKTDDDVGGERDIASRILRPLNPLEIPFPRVFALHCTENIG